ncbi:MAG TPA: hypothetical protein VJY15_04840 [Candidatus Acidoferrum sp.]|nr:hypothetical protein [Candidatus Acidoferrum sp.]
MPDIGRRDLLLLLIGLDNGDAREGLGGITRIQKLLYLLESEESIRPHGEGFKFEPYKAGPYSPRIYDDLEFLENLDYIRRSAEDERFEGATAPEKAEVDLSFEQLMGPEDLLASGSDEIAPTADSYEESRFYLTETGKRRMEELLADKKYRPFVDGIRKVKSRFSKYSLNDLLYYVYTRHPSMTTESEIKEKVLRRRPA